MAFPTVDFGVGTEGRIQHASDHITINTVYNKNVRINSQTFTTAASIVACQIKPRAGVAMTNDIIGLELMPGLNSTFTSTAGIVCCKAEPYIHSTAGAITGDVRGYEVSLGKPSGAGTITGVMSGIKFVHNGNATVTGGVYPIYVVTHGDALAWSGFALLPDDSVVANDEDTGTSGTKRGYVKLTVGSATRYIRLYDTGA